MPGLRSGERKRGATKEGTASRRSGAGRRQLRIALGGDAMLGRGVGAQLATAGPDGLVSDEVRGNHRGPDQAGRNQEWSHAQPPPPGEAAGKRCQ